MLLPARPASRARSRRSLPLPSRLPLVLLGLAGTALGATAAADPATTDRATDPSHEPTAERPDAATSPGTSPATPIAPATRPPQDAPPRPVFEAQVIDDAVEIGYGLAAEDVDGDGDRDLLLVDRREVRWYRNPDWKAFVLASDLAERDNVCLAARDLDGDGRCEVAVGTDWAPGDTEGSGKAFYLVGVDDAREQPWAKVELPSEPTLHRMRWLRLGPDTWDLVQAPLHGRGNRNGEGVGARLFALRWPGPSGRGEWAARTLETTFHQAHNLDVGQWEPRTEPEELLYCGREGAMSFTFPGGSVVSETLRGIEASGEIRIGHDARGRPFAAAVEPMHGNRLVVARELARDVLCDDLAEAHALACGDLLGDPHDEIVVGWRKPDGNGQTGIRLFTRVGLDWKSYDLTHDIACEDLRLADLDGDGDLDIAASGRATRDLRVLWNRTGE